MEWNVRVFVIYHQGEGSTLTALFRLG